MRLSPNHTALMSLPALVASWLLATHTFAQPTIPVGPELELHTAATSIANPEAAVDANRAAVVVWDEGPTNDRDVYGQLLDPEGGPIGDEFLVQATLGGSHAQPEVARAPSGEFVVVWQGYGDSNPEILARRYTSAGNPIGFPFQVNSAATPPPVEPSVAMSDDGAFVVAWGRDVAPGESDAGVYARRYGADGSPLDLPFRADQTPDPGEPVHPVVSVSPLTADFVIGWSAQVSGSFEVLARRYSALGAPEGDPFQVNTFTSNIQSVPTVDFSPDGHFVFAWRSRDQDGSGSGVYAQRFDEDENPIGSEFRVNTTTTSTQNFPDISLDDGGSFLVVRESFANDGDDYGIFGQRYGRSGETVGGEFQVHSGTVGAQQKATVALDGVGNGLVAWRSGEQTRGSATNALRAKRFARQRSSIEIADEFPVDPTTTNRTFTGDLARLSTGDLVAVYTRNEGSDEPALGRRFTAQGTAIGVPFLISEDACTFDYAEVAAGPSATFAVSFTDACEDQVHVRLFDGSVPLTDPILVDEDAKESDVAGSSVGFLTAYRGSGNSLRARAYNVNGIPQAPPANLTVGDDEAFHGSPSVAAFDDGSFLVVWSRQASLNTVVAQRLSPAGTFVGDRILVSETTTVSKPTVIPEPNGNLLVSWFEDHGTGVQMVVHAYDSSGQPVGAPRTFPGGRARQRPALQPLPDGGLVAVLEEVDVDTDLILLQADHSGLETFPRTRIHRNLFGSQRDSRIVLDSSGVATVIWESPASGLSTRLLGRQFSLPIFADGLETGTTARWSASQP